MKHLFSCLTVLLVLSSLAFAQPFPIDFATFSSDGETTFPIRYNGDILRQGRMIQIIAVVDSLHPPVTTGDLRGAPGGGDLLNSHWGIGEGCSSDGLFSLVLTGYPQGVFLPGALIREARFYCRIWADVNSNAPTPFPPGTHYVDGGPFVVDNAVWNVQVLPNSTNPNWQTLGGTAAPEEITIIRNYALTNYPNPFNASTQIAYSLPQPGNVRITIANMLGQQVAALVNGTANNGTHYVTWNATGLPSGIYFVKMETTTSNTTRQIMLTK